MPAYGVALSAVAGLPARVLLTVGRDLDVDALPEVPDNVHVERWVPQQDVLAHASAAVVHGGSGSTLGALAAGVPLVVVPLFADQPQNARRVHEVGAGLSVEPNREDIPATIRPLRAAIEQVLSEPSHRERADALAAELRAEAPVDDAVPLSERLGRR
jgi:MGT family glycosyltransferase